MKFKDKVRKELNQYINPEKADFSPRFFKTGPGEYGEGDKFLGVTVPNQRKVAKKLYKEGNLDDILTVLGDPYHEMRLTALLMLNEVFSMGDNVVKEAVYKAYLANTKFVNNWDLVDSSAHKIVGPWLEDKDKSMLHKLAKSKDLWEQRISMMATMHFVKNGDLDDTYKIAEILLDHEHDLIHKVVGWLLREAGKHDEERLHAFLKKYYKTMPRTMLRYAIEKFEKSVRDSYLRT